MTPRAAFTSLETAPEDVAVYERHFGRHELLDVHNDSLIMLPQIRSTVNSQLGKLMESIDQIGLLNPPNIARPDKEELAQYIDFTNETWGNVVTLNDFADKQQSDGRYNLVVAGHSRAISIERLAERHTTQTGQLARFVTRCMVIPDASVGSIVQIQAAENIHTQVPQEREAMAVVELYQFGVRSQPQLWSTPEEFKKQHSKISGATIRDAMTFVALPKPVRESVFRQHISYKAGIELGKITDLLYGYHAAITGLKPGEIPEEELQEQIQANVDEHLLGMVAHIGSFRNPLAIAPAVNYIKGESGGILKKLGELWATPTVEALFSELEFTAGPPKMATAFQQAAAERRRLQRKRQQTLRYLGGAPIVQVADRLSLFGEVDDSEGMQEVLVQTKRANDMLARQASRMIASSEAG